MGQGLGLPTTDIRIIIANAIRIALGLLGIAFVGIVLIGGFFYLTAGGNEERVEKAKAWLVRGVVGLAIILTSFAIAQFVFSTLLRATGAVEGGGGGGGPGGGGLPANAFVVRGITPSGEIPIRNVRVVATFSSLVDEASLGGNFVVATGGTEIPGSASVTNNRIEFVPAAACPPPNEDERCFPENTDVDVFVGPGLRSRDGLGVLCGGLAPSCQGRFRTGALVDTAPPQAFMIQPASGASVPENDSLTLQGRATDDAGVSRIEFSADGNRIGESVPQGASPRDYLTPLPPDLQSVSWDTTGVPRGTHSLQARAFDIDSHEGASSPVSVVVRAAHCFNGIGDGDESGLDCGGADCGACGGGACGGAADCRGGVCQGGRCVEIPLIERVDPTDAAGVPNGRPGNYVTIHGQFFGQTAGSVAFLGPTDGDGVRATLAACASAWSSTQIVVEVPAGARNGAVEVTAANDQSDKTNDARGPLLPDFAINDIARPGICATEPNRGRPGENFGLVGQGFGAAQGASSLALGGRVIAANSWADARIASQVPVVSANRYPVVVTVGGNQSNSVNFTVLSRESGAPPEIVSFDPPTAGPRGSFLTIFGRNFGNLVGLVRFSHPTFGTVLGETNLPNGCALAFWRDNTITVRVPRELPGGAPVPSDWTITVERPDGATSNARSWSVDASALRPGLCALTPDNGPAGIRVALSGERFGSAPDAVIFTQNQNAPAIPPVDWAPERVIATVPPRGASGPVVVRVAGQNSNARSFLVQDCRERQGVCGQGNRCCGNGVCVGEGEECLGGARGGGNAWRFSTGIIPIAPRVVEQCDTGPKPDLPSPSPWNARAGGNGACVNAVVSARFTTRIDNDSLRASVRVERCTAASGDPCTSAEPTLGSIDIFDVGQDGSREGFRFTPTAPFAVSSTYRVTITGSVQGEGPDGVAISRDSRACRSEGPDCAYAFRFGTRGGEELCEVGRIIVDPLSYTAEHRGRIQREIQEDGVVRMEDVLWNANVTARDDQCIILNPDAYPWQWFSSLPDRARVENFDREPPNPSPDPTQGGEALQETRLVLRGGRLVDEFAVFNATITGQRILGQSEVRVRFAEPRVTEVWPSCTAACVNAAIGARFSVPMQANPPPDLASVVNPSNVRLATQLCGNGRLDAGEDCDDGNENALDGCSVQCLHEGSNPDYGSICGNGRRETGEDCDGVPFPEGRCDRAACVNLGTGPLVCGNGVLDDGEDCDGGDGCTAACLHEGTAGLRVVGASLAYEPITQTLQILPDRALLRNTTYRVVMERRVQSADGKELGGLNWGPPGVPPVLYSWTFRTRDDDAACSVDHVTIAPERVTVRAIGAEESFVAEPFGAPDQCSVSGQHLLGESYGWTWQSSALPVATITNQNLIPQCGNRRVDTGEDCDDGNTASGDSCSGTDAGASCTFEGSGSYRLPQLDREGRQVIDDGVPQFYNIASVCGDNRRGVGEECDDGNRISGDGCNAQCLHEGSRAGGSVCGNRLVERGEDCDDGNTGIGDGCSDQCVHEGTVGDALVDWIQMATAVGVPPGKATGTSRISAQVEGKFGHADFTVQCGFQNDAQCAAINGAEYGLGSNTCCYLRPRPLDASRAPAAGAENACRNPMISVQFDALMDPGSVEGNVRIDEARSGGDGSVCLAGGGARAPGDPGPGRVWCEGTVGGSTGVVDDLGEAALGDETATILFTPARPLAPNTLYRVRVIGDENPADRQSLGVRSRAGVTMAGTYAWTFTTGADVCLLDQVTIDPSRLIFRSSSPPGNTRTVLALAQSLRAGRVENIASLPGFYAWGWQWDSLDPTIVQVSGTNNPTNAVAQNKNGETTIEATARITEANGVPEEVVGRSVTGTAEVTVFLCENPWAGFSDDAVNLKFTYCRDRGALQDTTDDYPSLDANPVPAPPLAAIVKEWILPVNCGGVGNCKPGDALGVRVLRNDAHLGAADWYRAQGFQGSPQSMTVDGYGAVRDGRTIYVNAANSIGAGNFTNIYVFSYNDTASADTQAIYNTIIGSVRLNTNLIQQDLNVCANDEGAVGRACAQNKGISCRTDAECGDKGPCGLVACTADLECRGGLHCASPKAKLRRDLKRFEQAHAIEAALERSFERNGKYPVLASGSFVPSFTTSKWPSWVSAFGNEAGSALPQDPLNQLGACPGFDAATCWNADRRQFSCSTGSEIYQYQSLRNGGRYVLSSDLEYGRTPGGPAPESSWRPNFPDGRPGVPEPTIRQEGGRPVNDFVWSGSCTGRPITPGSGICGNGLRDPGEDCDVAEPHRFMPAGCLEGVKEVRCNETCSDLEEVPGAICLLGRCGDGILNDGLGCDANRQNCSRGHGPVFGSAEECDDGALNGIYGHCNSVCTDIGPHCGDAVVSGPEVCDPNDRRWKDPWDEQNGFCSRTGDACGAESNCPFPVNVCLGIEVYGSSRDTSCSSDCTAAGPYCGDRIRNGPEACDGETQTLAARCVGGANADQACTIDRNCPGGACVFPDDRTKQWRRTCGVTCTRWGDWLAVAPGAACGNGAVDRNICVGGTNDTRRCDTDAQCPGGGICGEACDDGNDNNSDGCVIARNADGSVNRATSCRAARCGDSFVRAGFETCDVGPANGRACNPPYGGNCNYCTDRCSLETLSGGACGDGAVQPEAEVCENAGANDLFVQNICIGGVNRGRACTLNAQCPESTCGYPRRGCSQDLAQPCETNNDCRLPGGTETCVDLATLQGGEQCLADCRSACPPAFASFNLSLRTDPVPGFCSVSLGTSCARDSECPSDEYCATDRFRSDASSAVLANGDFVGLSIPACRVFHGTEITVLPRSEEAARGRVSVIFVYDRGLAALGPGNHKDDFARENGVIDKLADQGVQMGLLRYLIEAEAGVCDLGSCAAGTLKEGIMSAELAPAEESAVSAPATGLAEALDQ
ncbi:Ig-like domain-containing protein, partial [Candidatus Uhrbacteria bacterium]|nr:Ig-like domain-containing protein [Candidatus Uhrbacteria bacterium]